MAECGGEGGDMHVTGWSLPLSVYVCREELPGVSAAVSAPLLPASRLPLYIRPWHQRPHRPHPGPDPGGATLLKGQSPRSVRQHHIIYWIGKLKFHLSLSIVPFLTYEGFFQNEPVLENIEFENALLTNSLLN